MFDSESSRLLSMAGMSPLYLQMAKYGIYAASVVPIYDWFLCLDREIRLVWNWHSGITGASLVYVFSRYAVLIQSLVIISTNVPMSDLSCTAVVWTQTATGMLGTIAFGVFSALRVYALSNRNLWLAVIIALFALPPMTIRVVAGIYSDIENLPRPFDCIGVIRQLESLTLTMILRASQLVVELIVVVITFWHAYQSAYHLRKYGINVRTSLSSILIYNGSTYLLFLGSLYILDFIFSLNSVAFLKFQVGSLLAIFYDPITSIIVCHFMLSLRQFDSAVASATFSVHAGSLVLERTASTGPQFAAQPGDSLPAFIAAFAQPVNVDQSIFDSDPDAIVDDASERQEMDVAVRTQRTPPCSTRNSAPQSNRQVA